MRTPIKGPRYRPDRADAGFGLQAYSYALRALHDEAADASPPLPEFSASLCTGERWTAEGERREPGHPDAVTVDDVLLEREAVVLVGELGGPCRLSTERPYWLRCAEADGLALKSR